MGSLQAKIKILYLERGYTNDPVTLALGLCEEAGEVAKAVNYFHNPKYQSATANIPDSVQHELRDCLVYICAIANSLNIELDI